MEQTDKTQAEKIERLATEVMGWHYEEGHPLDVRHKIIFWRDSVGLVNRVNGKHLVKERMSDKDDRCCIWNPLTDWNHWRQVEEKVMRNPDLWATFIMRLWKNKPASLPNTELTSYEDDMLGVATCMNTDLPTRVDALLAALDSLKE